jgi:hypothetical protein
MEHLGQHEKTKPMSIEEEEIKTEGNDNLFNGIIAENFLNLEKERVTQVHKDFRTPNHQDQKGNIPRHIIIKTLSTQNKERILRTEKKKRQVIYKGKPIRITADFSTQTLNARRSVKDITQALRKATVNLY